MRRWELLNTKVPAEIGDIVVKPRKDIIDRMETFNHDDRDERLGIAILKLAEKSNRFTRKITKWKGDPFDLVVRVRNLTVPFDIHKCQLGYAVFIEADKTPHKDHKKYISPTNKAIRAKQKENKRRRMKEYAKKVLKNT